MHIFQIDQQKWNIANMFAYYEIIKAEQEGLITICRYDEFIKKRKEWLQKTIRDEFANSLLAPDYRFFLENKFADILAGK